MKNSRWTSFPCACENNGDANENSLVTNQILNVIEENENFAQGTFSFDFDGITYDNTFSETTIWDYANSDRYSNVTANFMLAESSGDASTQNYVLRYHVQHVDYNFSVATTLQHLDANTYNISATVVRFVPTGKNEWLSMEKVLFTSPVTLTKLYAELDKICKDLSQTYKKEGSKNNDAVLKDLAVNYGHMSDGLKDLSKLVHKELRSYDWKILQSEALLLDDSACAMCEAISGFIMGVVGCTIIDALVIATVCLAVGAPTFGSGAVICGLLASIIVAAVCGTAAYVGTAVFCSVMTSYCGYNYVDYCWSFGDGYVLNENNIIGAPDNDYATMRYEFYGQAVNLVGHLEQTSQGELRVHAKMSEVTVVWIHVSLNNNSDWITVYIDHFGYLSKFGWHDIVANSPYPYNYVAISAYDPNFVILADLLVDSISAKK